MFVLSTKFSCSLRPFARFLPHLAQMFFNKILSNSGHSIKLEQVFSSFCLERNPCSALDMRRQDEEAAFHSFYFLLLLFFIFVCLSRVFFFLSE